jgi:hypothetical protein
MLMTPLIAIRTARPTLSAPALALVEALCLVEGSLGPSDHVARSLGLRNRFRLARLLAREGLPTIHRMALWVTLLGWVRRSERDGTALCRMALHAGRYPGACYRQVREATGLSWEEIRGRGSAWVEREFLRELGVRDVSGSAPTSQFHDSKPLRAL